MEPPIGGLPRYKDLIDALERAPKQPGLRPFTEDVFSLFHRESFSAEPWVNELIVFAWLDGDRLLIADERGAASLGTLGEQEWENGWFDFAMLDGLRRESGGEVLPRMFGTEWVRIKNSTGATLLLLDEVDKAVSPEEGGRVLARVPPGGAVERPVLRARPPWLVVASGPKMHLDVTHSAVMEDVWDGIRFSVREAQFDDTGAWPRWGGFVVEVEDVGAWRMSLVIVAALIALTGWVAWLWWRVGWRSAR